MPRNPQKSLCLWSLKECPGVPWSPQESPDLPWSALECFRTCFWASSSWTWPSEVSVPTWERGLRTWNFRGCRRLRLEKPFLPKGRWPGKTTKLDRKMSRSGSRPPGLCQSYQATALKLKASPSLLRPPWTPQDTSWSQQDTKRKRNDQITKFLES